MTDTLATSRPNPRALRRSAFSPVRACLTRTLRIGAVLVCLTAPAIAAAVEPSLFERVQHAASCEDTKEEGRYCEYKIDDVLEIGIKDVGGPNTLIGFRRSNIDSELYAVVYAGCVAVVPGKSNKTGHHRDYGGFISPKDGAVYRSSMQCQQSLK